LCPTTECWDEEREFRDEGEDGVSGVVLKIPKKKRLKIVQPPE